MTVHGRTVWVAQRYLNRLWAYSLDTKARTPGKDITLHPDNGDRSALWTDGTTMWVADSRDRKLYAYAVSDGARQRDKEFDITNLNPQGMWSDNPQGMWSDGTTMWITNASHIRPYGAFAYKLSDGTRQPGKDYDFYRSLYGMWSNGTTTWLSLQVTQGGAVLPYVAVPPTKRLEAGGVTGTSATLTLYWHTGNWHYKADHRAGHHLLEPGPDGDNRQPERADLRPVVHVHGLQRQRLHRRQQAGGGNLHRAGGPGRGSLRGLRAVPGRDCGHRVAGVADRRRGHDHLGVHAAAGGYARVHRAAVGGDGGPGSRRLDGQPEPGVHGRRRNRVRRYPGCNAAWSTRRR